MEIFACNIFNKQLKSDIYHSISIFLRLDTGREIRSHATGGFPPPTCCGLEDSVAWGVFPCVLMLIHDLIYPRMLGHYYVYVIYYMY